MSATAAEGAPTLFPHDSDLPDMPEGRKAEPPTTPVRGRTASRYPAILSKGNPGRVPLHRRGTSRILEAMEDLLRENGYKETRVFTPEAEHAEALAEERRRQSIWRIPDFISGWLPAPTAGEPASEHTSEHTPVPTRSHISTTSNHRSSGRDSTPNSPLGHKRRLQDNSASSLSSLASGTAEGRTVSYNPTRPHLHAVRVETSSASLRTYAQVSAARGYLRHMVSAPDFPKRKGVRPHEPSMNHPLPPSWLDSVAKAVSQSGENAHIGGPMSRPSSRLSDRPPRTAKMKASLATPNASRASGRDVSRLPPGATLYLRSQTALGAVNTAYVVCRSAPGSRSSSRAGDHWTSGGASFRAAPRKDGQARERRGSRPTTGERVPSLATTRVENDSLSNIHWVDGIRVPLVRMDMDDLDEEALDDDDDDELDFERLLIPSRRQHSIGRLRQHLHAAHAHLLPHERWNDGEGVATRQVGHHVNIDEVDGYPTIDRGDSKRRRALPGAWSNP